MTPGKIEKLIARDVFDIATGPGWILAALTWRQYRVYRLATGHTATEERGMNHER